MAPQRSRTRDIHVFILSNISDHPSDIVVRAAEHFGISRQAVLEHVRRLKAKGLLRAEGNTRSRRYTLLPVVDEEFTIAIHPGLPEDVVWHEHVERLLRDLPKAVLDVCYYGFTEMFNNVIDHSGATLASVAVRQDAAVVEIGIRDNGVGIFFKIQQALGLEDPRFAILELAKGKVTTDPEHHSGEGIFFTSRMCDRFSILSGSLYFAYSPESGDWLLENKTQSVQGTWVTLRVNVHSTRTLREVFDRYADVDEGFSRTHVPVSLARFGDEQLVSRSQAKRLLARVSRFREILLDFKGVESIGPAFADEIFRVFIREYPEARIVPVGANEMVSAMIRRAQAAAAEGAARNLTATAGQQG